MNLASHIPVYSIKDWYEERRVRTMIPRLAGAVGARMFELRLGTVSICITELLEGRFAFHLFSEEIGMTYLHGEYPLESFGRESFLYLFRCNELGKFAVPARFVMDGDCSYVLTKDQFYVYLETIKAFNETYFIEQGGV